MKGKLIKIDEEYHVYDDSELMPMDLCYSSNGSIDDPSKKILHATSSELAAHLHKIGLVKKIIGTTWELSRVPRLSFSNCRAIELGYDSDLLDSKWNEFYTKHHKGDMWSFNEGFQKAFESFEDRKFTEEEVIKIVEKSRNTGLTAEYIIQAQQQTGWDVEIQMETTWIGQCDCPCHTDNGIMVMHFMPCCNPKKVESPKLDEWGNLILKRI